MELRKVREVLDRRPQAAGSQRTLAHTQMRGNGGDLQRHSAGML